MNRKEHWEKVYGEKKPTEVSWYQEVPRKSVELVRWGVGRESDGATPRMKRRRESGERDGETKWAESSHEGTEARRHEGEAGKETGRRSDEGETGKKKKKDCGIIDVGGGASVLVDCLLDDGFKDVTVLDVSGGALREARERLGARAKQVEWIESDVTTFEPARTWRIWHDRAVFHFLTEESDRRAYVRVLKRALAPDGCAIISTFGPDGPQMCSGLNVMRNDARGVLAELGEDEFELLRSEEEAHVTPWGKEQKFVYGVFGRKGT